MRWGRDLDGKRIGATKPLFTENLQHAVIAAIAFKRFGLFFLVEGFKLVGRRT